MARASNIYVVRDDVWPVAAFTVKHELGRWLLRQTEDYRATIDVWRLRDNRPDIEPVRLPVQEILAEAAAAVLR